MNVYPENPPPYDSIAGVPQGMFLEKENFIFTIMMNHTKNIFDVIVLQTDNKIILKLYLHFS